jgi:hypothetical protein
VDEKRQALKKFLKSFVIAISVTVGSIVLCIPFASIEWSAGFVVLGLLILLYFAFQKRVRSPRKPFIFGFVIAFILLFPLAFFARIAEGGFDDGPFTGRPFVGAVDSLIPTDSVAFRGGQLLIYNRIDNQAPIISYIVKGEISWTREMFVSMRDNNYNQLWGISEPSVAYGIVRDRLDFQASWTYGIENGYAYIWKFGGIQKFYLSW